MGADKNSSRRTWRLQQDEHNFQHTSPTHYPSWPSPRSHCSAIGPLNQLSISQTRERSGTLLGNSGKHITLETSKSNGILEVCFSGAGNSRIQEVWDLRSLEFADVQSSGTLFQ
jgi:hypothetical protein